MAQHGPEVLATLIRIRTVHFAITCSPSLWSSQRNQSDLEITSSIANGNAEHRAWEEKKEGWADRMSLVRYEGIKDSGCSYQNSMFDLMRFRVSSETRSPLLKLIRDSAKQNLAIPSKSLGSFILHRTFDSQRN